MPRLHPTPEAVGRAIYELRTEHASMSREALAEAANLSTPYLWGIETGRRNPTLLVLTRLAHALDITVSELLARAERESRAIRDGDLHT